MGSIWKVILGVFVCVVIIFTTIGVIGANNDAMAADAYLQKVAAEISASNFNEEAINELIAEATTNNYTLEVELSDTLDETGTPIYAIAKLKYKYKVALISLVSEHTKEMLVK